MTPFVLPLTVRTDDADTDLLIDLAGPTSLGQVLPAIRRRAGLPADSTLHLGHGVVDDSWVLGRAPLLAGRVLSTRPDVEATAVGPVQLSCVAGPDAGPSIPMPDRPIVVGRHPDCDLTLDDPELSRRHARVELAAGVLLVTDLESSNGVRVDGEARPRAGPGRPVPVHGLIRLGASILRSGLAAEPSLLLSPDGAGHLAVARPARVAPEFRCDVPPPPGPPPTRGRRPIPVLAALFGAGVGVVIALVTGLWTFLLLAALGPAMMLATAVSDRLSGRRGFRRASREHLRAVSDHRVRVGAALAADRLDAWDRYPDPATLGRRAASAGVRLWERRPGNPDFLRLAVGIGERKGRIPAEDAPLVAEVPLTLDLAAIGVLGIAGACRGLVRHLLSQLLVLHSPADLRIHLFTDDPELRRLRDLPHVELHADRVRATAGVARILSIAREATTVVVLDDAHRWRRTPRMNELLIGAARPATAASGLTEVATPRPGPGSVAAICIATAAEALPVECTAVAVVGDGQIRVRAGSHHLAAETVGVSRAHLERVVAALTPLIDPDRPGAGLPDEVWLSDLFGTAGVRAGTARRWVAPSLTVGLGTGAAGTVEIDLERDGPHVLIAGTTGSGKSELLQTLVAGLACAAPPDRTAFLLIDYKGGAAFGRLADLPHTTGVVTDLDQAEAARALTSLRAEVRRRERLLADSGAADLAGLRVDRPDGCPPSLVVVVDEYATLGAERPEFLAGLLDVAQRGRSLGLHLVLATQRPAGVLSPAMKANIGLRICLRVTDDADSLDVIDSPEAAQLPPWAPGRAYLRRAKGRTTLFQVARATGIRREQVRVRDDLEPAEAVTVGPTILDEVIEVVTGAAVGRGRPDTPWLPPLPDDYRPDGEAVLALRDVPDEQRQTEIGAPAGSTLVLGRPGSGRSSTLRRLAWCAATDGAELVVVDPSGGLRELADWPSTRTYLDGHDPVLVHRLIDRLRVVRRARVDGTGSPLLLLIDGWDAMAGPLDGLDYGGSTSTVTDLAGGGPSAGMRVAVSGDLRMEHHRTAGAFTTVIRLGVDARNDPCGAPPGRGRLLGAEIQVAHGPPGAPSSDPVGHGAPVVRALPVIVTASQLPDPRADAVPLGVGDDDGSVQVIDLTGPGGGLLVAGPRRSGVSTALARLAVGAAAAGVRVVRATVRPAPGLPGVEDIILGPGAGPLHRLLLDHDGPILLVADDLDRPDWPDDALALFERFVTVAGPGQYLAAAARLERALRSHRGPIAEIAAFRTGILLHPDSADGTLFDVTLPRRQGQPPAGRGYLVRQGRAVPLQLAGHPL
ncbi:DNA segregation ATPase FtsK/SpoIIIE, S-DNA-T family [Nakamurella panacisegetis]|uniref:DNA segregation ATPase FtsK/SpoIIIE, S-DNA-T family n=1 Tax=Nakamurella panacisegetis TaxID=1090615 RepID=A0A1H0I5S8_9ACTN|nr:FtsK/SpoIIIE domain-containing protein [Nakamurella panacisegetis]SDO26769.1 DNA segregation ATPase FtsK/SpoIIIE, S-DNA-T family [Nakamurella panacisegetis]